MAEALAPVRVQAPRGADTMKIEWNDGSSTQHPHLVLRGLCPCAHCQGHQGGVRWVSEVEQPSSLMLELQQVAQVGNYALGLQWADGHSGGIYTFEFLRRLAPLSAHSLKQLREFSTS